MPKYFLGSLERDCIFRIFDINKRDHTPIINKRDHTLILATPFFPAWVELPPMDGNISRARAYT